MQITKLEKQKKNETRFSVFIDDEFAFGLSGVDVLFYKLEEGMELSQEKYHEILEDAIFSKARDRAIRFLSYRARSREEVRERLSINKNEDYSDETIERVIDLMAKYGYIDDSKFAVSYIKDKTNINGFGSIRIKHELKEKGVSRETIDHAYDQLDIDEVEVALSVLEKKIKNGISDNAKENNKVYEFLIRRGFSHEIIASAMTAFEEKQSF